MTLLKEISEFIIDKYKRMRLILQAVTIYLIFIYIWVVYYEELKRSQKDRHTETVSRYFDWHGSLSQSKESKCLWTHDKDGITREFMKGATRGLREGWMEGNYLRLMPGMSLEDRTNW